MSPNGSNLAVTTGSSVLYFDKHGKLAWNFTTSSLPNIAMSSDGAFLVATGSSLVYLLNNNGRSLWKHAVSDGEFVGPVEISPNRTCIAVGADNSSENGDVYLLNRQGSLLWKNHVASAVFSTSTSSNGSYTAAGVNWGLIYFDKQGKVLWKYSYPYGDRLFIP
jgi:hypothetical protein